MGCDGAIFRFSEWGLGGVAYGGLFGSRGGAGSECGSGGVLYRRPRRRYEAGRRRFGRGCRW